MRESGRHGNTYIVYTTTLIFVPSVQSNIQLAYFINNDPLQVKLTVLRITFFLAFNNQQLSLLDFRL